MNDKASELIISIGALAEMSGEFMKQLLKQCFSREEALALVRTFIHATLTKPNNKEDN